MTTNEIAELLGALKSGSLDLRYAAAEILAQEGVELEAAVPVLAEALHSESDADCQLAAAALVALGARAVPVLEQGLRDPKVVVRSAAVQALGEIAAPAAAALPALVSVVDDPDPEVRAVAVRAIARFGKTSAKLAGPRLVAATRDESQLVRYGAASALITLDYEVGHAVDPIVDALADANPLVRKSAAEILRGLGAHARSGIPALVKAIEDEDTDVRVAAIFALGELGTLAASAFAVITVISDDPSEPEAVRSAAEWAIERMV